MASTIKGQSRLLDLIAAAHAESVAFDAADNYPQVICEGPAKLLGLVVTNVMSAHATLIYNDVVTPAVSAVNLLGAFTVGVGGDGTSTYTITLDNSDGRTLAIVTTGAATSIAMLAARFVVAGFAADGSGDVSGYTLDLGAATTITAAITAGTLSIVREDGVDFTTVEAVGGTAFDTDPTFATLVSPTTSGTLAAVSGDEFLMAALAASAAVGANQNTYGQIYEDGIVAVPGNAAATGRVIFVFQKLPSF